MGPYSERSYQPEPQHKFSFGLWTLANRGRDPFGDFVRPVMSPEEVVGILSEIGAWGVNLHDNDLVPIDASPSERDAIVRSVPARTAGSRYPWPWYKLAFKTLHGARKHTSTATVRVAPRAIHRDAAEI
jgi:hypothetical protein